MHPEDNRIIAASTQRWQDRLSAPLFYPSLYRQIVILLRIDYRNPFVRTPYVATVTYLAAGIAVERRTVEDELIKRSFPWSSRGGNGRSSPARSACRSP